MNYQRKYKWALTGFIIMVILNLGTLVTIWVIKPPHRADLMHNRGERMQHFITRELDLTDAQKEQFRSIRQRHIRETRSILEEMHHHRRAYFQLLKEFDRQGDSVRVDSLASLIARDQARLERSIYQHFSEIRSILNEDQKAKFEQLIDRIMRRMTGDNERRRRSSRGLNLVMFNW